MTAELTYIPDDIAAKINDIADVVEVAETLFAVKKKGSSHVCNCPSCGAKDSLTLTRSKQIFKCFKCELGGKGAAALLMDTQQLTYPDALLKLARQYNIDIPKDGKPLGAAAKKESFRNAQLVASGIALESQKWAYKVGEGKAVEINRYESGTVDDFFKIKSGDDMILNYISLEGFPLQYRDAKGVEKSFVRVRWQNPELHQTKDGKTMKYKSPYKSGSQLWLPNRILKAYQTHETFETLYITEGEKKSDKMCAHDLMTVGIGGIHNLSFEGMTSQFERLIKRCGVKNVVFVLDSDWYELSKDENVDSRPRTFCYAVQKFRDYFYGYKNADLELNIFFAYGKNKALKGMDDLLVRGLKGEEQKLTEDFNLARIDREGKGEYVDVHAITLMSPYKIQEFWHLENTLAFLKHHEAELKMRKVFRINKHSWHWNVDAEGGAKFEMIEKILEHEKYWTEEDVVFKDGRKKTLYNFNYYNCLHFLKNRGYGLYELGGNKFRMVKVENKIVREVDHHMIQQYVKNFTEDLGEIPVLNMILRGGTQYLGPHQLSQMYYIKPEFAEPEREAQYLIFKNCYWRITADDIKQGPLSELPKFVWADKMINFEPKYYGSAMAKVNRTKKADGTEGWDIKESEECKTSDMWKFFLATSNFNWRKTQEVVHIGDNKAIIKAREDAEKMTIEDVDALKAHIVSKMLAAGYVLHEYRNKAQMKAIICMDGAESEVGKSQGGSGKSIYATMFEHLMPTVVIDGKKRNLTEDPHIYDAVDERTNILVFDDCRVNLDFEFFFSQITRGVEVNQKGLRRFTIPAPKFLFSTNHAIKGSDNSTTRRQYLLSFSDYFNAHRTPQDEFGHLMFGEWEWEEWNKFYNLMATCIQTYMRFPDLNKYTIPTADLEKRKLRQEIGENFLDFAELYFGEEELKGFENIGGYRNCAVNKEKVVNDYLEKFPNERKYMSSRIIKSKVEAFCRYAGFEFNPNAGADGRVKFGKDEYLVVGDESFVAKNIVKVG